MLEERVHPRREHFIRSDEKRHFVKQMRTVIFSAKLYVWYIAKQTFTLSLNVYSLVFHISKPNSIWPGKLDFFVTNSSQPHGLTI